MKKIAVVLAGCGNKDGTEITEAVSLIVGLSQGGAYIEFFAPDLAVGAKNFLTNQLTGEKRSLILESARITRSQIKDLKQLKASDFDALAIPGGQGAALHLCNWAEKGAQCQVLPDLEKIILDFYNQSLPIAALCIAPVLLARVLGKKGITVTAGFDQETALEIQKTGALTESCPADDFITDRSHKIITTPAYMIADATPAEVFKGISGLTQELLEMA